MNPKLLKLMQVAAKRKTGLATVAGRRAEALLSDFTGWYSGEAAAGLAARLGALAERTAATAAMLTDVADGLMIREITGRTAVRGPRTFDDLARLGVTGFEVYDRIPAHYRYAMSQGLTDQMALRSTVDRVKRMVELDISLAAREQHRATFSANSGVVDGYRRVIRPELSKTGTCGLCVAASDQVYAVENLMPIHPGCNCAVMPIIDGYDPGDYVNTMDLRRVYETATEGGEVSDSGVPTRSQLSSVRVTIDQHGEYGPMLKHAAANDKKLEDLTDTVRDQRKMDFELRMADIEARYREAVVKQAATGGPDKDVIAYEQAIKRMRGRRRYMAHQQSLVTFHETVE